jgi:hypothetical protein
MPHLFPNKPSDRNDFGGTLGRFLDIPHLYNDRNRTFFFFSYGGTAPDQPNTLRGSFSKAFRTNTSTKTELTAASPPPK